MKESENQSTFGEFLARVYSDSLFDSHCTIQQATQQQPRRNEDIGQYDVWAFAVPSSPSWRRLRPDIIVITDVA